MKPNAEIADLARSGEPDRYLAALLAPPGHQADLLTLAAFAAELRRIPHLVQEPMMGEMRLQWWRERIETSHLAEPQGHALADALGALIRRHDLPPAILAAVTEARAFDLYTDPMPDDPSLRGYLDKTETLLFSTAFRILGRDEPAIASLAGAAYGRARLLADLPLALSRGRLPLPMTQLQTAGCNEDDLRHGRSTDAVRQVLRDVAKEALAGYSAVQVATRGWSRRQRVGLLPLATIPSYLHMTKTADPLRHRVDVVPLLRIARITKAHWLGF